MCKNCAFSYNFNYISLEMELLFKDTAIAIDKVKLN